MPVIDAKQQIASRNLCADFVDRQLPDVIDVQTNAGLLATLGITIKDEQVTEQVTEEA